jgi:hypothetical protein
VPALTLQSPAIPGTHIRQTKLAGTDTPTMYLHWNILQALDVLPVLTPFRKTTQDKCVPTRNGGIFTLHTAGAPTARSKVSPQELPVSALH